MAGPAVLITVRWRANFGQSAVFFRLTLCYQAMQQSGTAPSIEWYLCRFTQALHTISTVRGPLCAPWARLQVLGATERPLEHGNVTPPGYPHLRAVQARSTSPLRSPRSGDVPFSLHTPAAGERAQYPGVRQH
ncbi:hypothetical protein B0H19DRAFT_1258337 [Mycena capillaripes]|nr:hypothetical protein B0H19DRAFT_1258337 [Mycena capillaripes]